MEEDLEIELLAKQAVLAHRLLPIFRMTDLLPVKPVLLTDCNRQNLTNDLQSKRTNYLPVQQRTKNVRIADRNSILTSKKSHMNKVSFDITYNTGDVL